MRYLRGWKAREELNKGRLGSGLKQFWKAKSRKNDQINSYIIPFFINQNNLIVLQLIIQNYAQLHDYCNQGDQSDHKKHAMNY